MHDAAFTRPIKTQIIKRELWDSFDPVKERHGKCAYPGWIEFIYEEGGPQKWRTYSCRHCQECRNRTARAERKLIFAHLEKRTCAKTVTFTFYFRDIAEKRRVFGKPPLQTQLDYDEAAIDELDLVLKRVEQRLRPKTRVEHRKYWERHTDGGENDGQLHCHVIMAFPDAYITHDELEIAISQKNSRFKWRDKIEFEDTHGTWRAETDSEYRRHYAQYLHGASRDDKSNRTTPRAAGEGNAQEQWRAATDDEKRREKFPFRCGFIDIVQISSVSKAANYVSGDKTSRYVTKDLARRPTGTPGWGNPDAIDAKWRARHLESVAPPNQRQPKYTEHQGSRSDGTAYTYRVPTDAGVAQLWEQRNKRFQLKPTKVEDEHGDMVDGYELVDTKPPRPKRQALCENDEVRHANDRRFRALGNLTVREFVDPSSDIATTVVVGQKRETFRAKRQEAFRLSRIYRGSTPESGGCVNSYPYAVEPAVTFTESLSSVQTPNPPHPINRSHHGPEPPTLETTNARTHEPPF